MSLRTKGPWVVDIVEGGLPWLVCSRSGPFEKQLVATLGTDEEAHANARLIAAAPDMASAIEEAVENCETCGPDEHNLIKGMTDGSRFCARCQTFIKILEEAWVLV